MVQPGKGDKKGSAASQARNKSVGGKGAAKK